MSFAIWFSKAGHCKIVRTSRLRKQNRPFTRSCQMEQVWGKLMRAIKHVGLLVLEPKLLGQRCMQPPVLWAMKRRLQQLDGTITCIVHCVSVAARQNATKKSTSGYHLSYKSLIRFSCSIYFWCYDPPVSHSAIYIPKAERNPLLDQPRIVRMAHHSNLVESSCDLVSSTSTCSI